MAKSIIFSNGHLAFKTKKNVEKSWRLQRAQTDGQASSRTAAHRWTMTRCTHILLGDRSFGALSSVAASSDKRAEKQLRLRQRSAEAAG